MKQVVIDLVDSSEEEDDDERINENDRSRIAKRLSGGKRKTMALMSPVSLAPLLHQEYDGETSYKANKKNLQLVRQVSPDFEEQEVVVVEEISAIDETVTNDNNNIAEKVAASKAQALPTRQQQPTKPPQLVLHKDNGVVTYGIVSSVQSLKEKLPFTNSKTVQHIQQLDNWSCGFRNTQMLLSALVPILPLTHAYHNVVAAADGDGSCTTKDETELSLVLPSLTKLQQLLELSWQSGFDPKGANHFRYNIVGEVSRIGAVEVASLFGFCYIDSCVVQFIKTKPSRQCLPAFCYHYFCAPDRRSEGDCNEKSAKEVAEKSMTWAEQHGKSTPSARRLPANSYNNTHPVLPMYLQWEGHSVTVIGVEPFVPGYNNMNDSWNQMNLLVLDPNRSGATIKSKLLQASSSTQTTAVAPLRLSCRSLVHKDCQLVLVGTKELTESQRLARKSSSVALTAAASTITDKQNRDPATTRESVAARSVACDSSAAVQCSGSDGIMEAIRWAQDNTHTPGEIEDILMAISAHKDPPESYRREEMWEADWESD
jgi:hypothetical protein